MGYAHGKIREIVAFTTVNVPPSQDHERGNFYFLLDGYEAGFVIKDDSQEKFGANAVISFLCSAYFSQVKVGVEYDDSTQTGGRWQVYKASSPVE